MNMTHPGEPPRADDYIVEVISVAVTDLFVDHEYQRAVSPGRVKYLVHNWNWRRYFPIIVGHRRGRYAVIDGQQRFQAAQELGIESLPAILVISQTIEDEAELFLGANTAKPVGAGDRFRARLIIKEPKALEMLGIVRTEGFNLSCATDKSHSRDAFCIDAVYAVELIFDAGYLNRVLGIIRRAWGDKAVHDMVSASALQGVYLALRHLDRFETPEDEIVKRWKEAEVAELTEKSYERYKSMVASRSIPGAYAAVLVDFFNLRRRDPLPAYSGRALTGDHGGHTLIPGGGEHVERGPRGRYRRKVAS